MGGGRPSGCGNRQLRIDGPVLFDGSPLIGVIEERITQLAREGMDAVRSAGTKISAASVRKAIMVATELNDVPILDQPTPVAFGSTSSQIRALATVPFTGTAAYFSYRTPTSPKLRAVRATVEAKHVIVSAYSSEIDCEWLPSLLAAEIQTIRHYLDFQAAIVKQFNRDRKARINDLAVRFVADIKRRYL